MDGFGVGGVGVSGDGVDRSEPSAVGGPPLGQGVEPGARAGELPAPPAPFACPPSSGTSDTEPVGALAAPCFWGPPAEPTAT
ncbi:hypothetical protein GCM10010260_42360 [Streptomyces filipinensis]|uniref:Uncharacterized protein n=1 Tax=Streptomyces filipinensis TaxID=66887 RepID=A0A918ICF1_9ACTN|nr:hypothetical protein GCM10010260_42360 [Streptomyces filipinensis]